MSEQISFNRDKGFVALPVGVLDMDLSPGAFRTLVELCRMANMEGYCWPSLTQLSDRLGRSKSAISGYLKELRGVGLVATEEQRTAIVTFENWDDRTTPGDGYYWCLCTCKDVGPDDELAHPDSCRSQRSCYDGPIL